MYPYYGSVKKYALREIKEKLGGHVKVRFTNRDGKFYVQVIDEKNPIWDNVTMNVIRCAIENHGGCHASLTSAGNGRYTMRWHVQDFRS